MKAKKRKVVRKQKDKMNLKKRKVMCTLTDDLVVEILSRLSLKSFCRCKCVCKSWLALSTGQYFRKSLPRTPAGLLYQHRDSSPIHFARLPSGDGEIDTSLCFMPSYENLELVDCCNGLLLCNYGSRCSSPDTSHFVVCNPATREWISLPDTRLGPNGSCYVAMLAFNPSWSPHFYVFNFQKRPSPRSGLFVVTEVEIFSSEDMTWIVDDAFGTEIAMIPRPHVFLCGNLYLRTVDHSVLVIEAPDMHTRISRWTIELPGDSCPMQNYIWGCLGQSSEILHYVQPYYDGSWLEVWRFEGYDPVKWSITHRLSMIDAFGRDIFVHGDSWGDHWSSDYDMLSFDLERETIFILDHVTHKMLSYSMSSGKLTEIGDQPKQAQALYYVPYWHKFPTAVA